LLWRRQRVLWLVYAMNFLLALMAARGFADLAGRTLDHSLAADRLVHGFDLGRLVELAFQPNSPVRASMNPTHFSIVIFSFFMLFVTGGMLVSFYEDRRLTAGPFFEACGNYFWRFLRLALYFFVAMIPIGILIRIAASLHGRIDAQSISPYPAVYFLAGAAAVILLLLMCVRLWFDMAEIIAVAEYERKMHRALRRSARLVWNNFASLFWLYLRISLVGWALFAIGLHLWMDHVPPDALFRAFLVGQAMIVLWLAARLWQRASEALWYRRHQAAFFAAAPAPASPEPSTASAVAAHFAPEVN